MTRFLLGLAAAYTLPLLLLCILSRVETLWPKNLMVYVGGGWTGLVFGICARRWDRVGWVSLLLVALFTCFMARVPLRRSMWRSPFRIAGETWLGVSPVLFVLVEIVRVQR
jgi:hypothetical protein